MDIEMDSDLDDILEFDLDLSVVPYAFEPMRNNPPQADSESSSDEESDSDLDSDDENNISLSDWCSCSHCIVMPSARENQCCMGTHVVDGVLETEGLDCITSHEGFPVNCTNRYVLLASYQEYVKDKGPMREGEAIHELYRYLAYRRFTRLMHGLLGNRHRRIIPSCVVTAIRKAFPSQEYCGFKYPDE